MAKLIYANGTTGVILRVRIADSTSTSNAGLTGIALPASATGLSISTIADNEATATVYTVAAGTIEGIDTLGTFAAPTATKCRFLEVDATNHPGLYEIQIADARWAVSGARSVVVTVKGCTNAAQVDAEIQLKAVPVDFSSLNDLSASEVADAVWNAPLASYTTPDTIGEQQTYAEAPTAAEIADAVWDEARSGHVASGSFGERVNANVTQISGDSTAADNLELDYDGTGYSKTNSSIGSVIAPSLPVAVPEMGVLAGETLTAAVNGVPDLEMTVLDEDGLAINLSAATLEFVVSGLNAPNTVKFRLTTASGLTVGGAGNNVVTASLSSTHTATPGTWRYDLWRTDGDDTVLASGVFVVNAAGAVSA